MCRVKGKGRATDGGKRSGIFLEGVIKEKMERGIGKGKEGLVLQRAGKVKNEGLKKI